MFKVPQVLSRGFSEKENSRIKSNLLKGCSIIEYNCFSDLISYNKHGSFVFGGSSGYEAFNKDNGTPTTSSITASCICRGIMKYFPMLKDVKIVRTWAGWIDECKDLIPVISFVDEVPDFILACAFTGHGFGISPTVGMLLSEMVEGKETTLDINAFRYDRFKAKI